MSTARRLLLCEYAFLSGVALTELFGLWPASAAIAFGIIGAFRKRWFGIILTMLFLAGTARFAFADRPIPTAHGLEQHTLFLARVVDVDHRLDEQRVTAHVLSQNSVSAASEKILLTTRLYPEYRYGDVLRVECARMDVPGDDSYGRYLRLHGIDGLCRLPDVQLLENRPASRVVMFSVNAREWFVGRLEQLFPEPQAALAAGILFGAKQGIPAAVTHAFQQTGVSHILALSGYNITVIITAVFAVCLAIGVPRRRALWMVFVGLIAFLGITGLSASVVRAAIMGTIVLVARHLGRRSTPLYALVFSAMVMTALSPHVLLDDVGFQLSFLATAGLFWIASWFEHHIRFVPATLGLREALSSTLGATVATLPLLLIRFDVISLVSPLTNVLVVPIIPLAMFLTTIALIVPFAGTLFALLGWLVMAWVLTVTELLSRLPFASATGVPLGIVLLVYAVVLVFIAVRWCSRQCILLSDD